MRCSLPLLFAIFLATLSPREVYANSLEQRVAERRAARSAELSVPVSYNTLRSNAIQRRIERSGAQPIADRIQELLKAINFERALAGIRPVRIESTLTKSAQNHALDMFERNYFDHENPEGERIGARACKVGYGGLTYPKCQPQVRVSVGENLAIGQQSVEEVVEDWMNSEGHRNTMLSPEYQEIGIGIVDRIWVLNFGGIEPPVRSLSIQ